MGGQRRSELVEQERSYKLVTKEKKESGKLVKQTLRFLFSQVGLIVLGIFTATLGAEAFILLESPYEQELYALKREAGKEVESAANYLTATFWNYVKDEDKYNFTYDEFTEKAEEDLRMFTSFVINKTRDFNYDGHVEGWHESWTYPKALLFTITIMTTIGYGHIYPLTLTGKLFTIIYALMALGVFFAILANIGSALANGLTYVYSRICCRCFRIQRVKSEIPSRVMRKKLRRRLVDEEIGEEAFMPTSSIPIPIVVSVMILFGYIGVGAVLFHKWENWDVTTAAYFSFITLTTIGFGDYSPIKSFEGIDEVGAGGEEFIKLIFSTLYCAIGLAVISLCISLIQEQIGRSAAIAMGVQHHVIELDIVEIIPRRNNFLTSDETPEDIAEENNTTVIAGGAVVVPDGEESNLPGEVGDEKDEDEDENEDEDEDEEGEDEDEDDDEEEDGDDEEEGGDEEEEDGDDDEGDEDEDDS